MPEVDDLYNLIQSTSLTVQKLEQYVKNFQDAASRVRNFSITYHAKICLNLTLKNIQVVFRKFVFFLCFPCELIEAVNEFYPVVDCKKLQSDLNYIYNRQEIHKAGLVKTLLYKKNSNLTSNYSESNL